MLGRLVAYREARERMHADCHEAAALAHAIAEALNANLGDIFTPAPPTARRRRQSRN